MNYELLTSYIVFMFICQITPGPNNIMVMMCGLQNGVRGSQRFVWGVVLASSLLMLIAYLFTEFITRYLPQVELPLKIASVTYMVWLAWRVFCSMGKDLATPSQTNTPSKTPPTLNSLPLAFGLQFLNAKLIVYTLVSANTFYVPLTQGDPIIFALIVLGSEVSVFLILNAWALLGQRIQHLQRSWRNPIRITFALSLLYCAWQIV